MTSPPTGTASARVADALARMRAGETVAAPTATPTPTVTAPGKTAKRISFPRHDGTPYYARMVTEDKHDVQILRESVGERLKDNIYLLLHGEPGTGKTASYEAAFPNGIIIQGNGDTTVDDLLGSWVVNPDGTHSWVDGPLVFAAINGLPVLVDEVAQIDSKVLLVLYGSMDGRGIIDVRTNPLRGTVKVQPGFIVVGACNPNAPGAQMSEALLSRFTAHLEATTDYDLAKNIGVSAKAVTVAKNLAAKQASSEVSWAPQMRELLAFRRNEARFGLGFATQNLVGIAPQHDRAIVADVVSRVFGSAIGPLRQGNAALEGEKA